MNKGNDLRDYLVNRILSDINCSGTSIRQIGDPYLMKEVKGQLTDYGVIFNGHVWVQEKFRRVSIF